MYATSTATQTASPTQPGSDASSADSSLDESWVDMGKHAPVVDPKDPSNRPKRWYPFSDGPRSCVGQSLAYMNLAGTLAALLARFHFRLADQVMYPLIITHACIDATRSEALFCVVFRANIPPSHVASNTATMQ